MSKRHLSRSIYSILIFVVAAYAILTYGINGSQAQNDRFDLSTAIQNVARRAVPAVVHIEVTERREVPNPLLPFENEPFFKYFFGNPKGPKTFQREVQGLGSGVIIDESGHILTNYHVVGGANKIKVILADGREFSGTSIKTVGTDQKTDLAVIQIVEKGPFPYLPLGDSDQMEVGQWVVAIGQPRGLTETVTQGIISAKHRTGLSDPSSYQDYLQTDAAINPGNSGGPLVNLNGEVIGINAAIMTESGGFEGLGFAVPSNIAVHISQELIKNGKIVRGWLGLSLQNLTPDLAKSFGINNTKGALVADVIKGGPASLAGMRQGDVITDYEGKRVEDPSSLRNSISLAPVGSEINLTVLRDGAKQQVTVKVGSLEEQEKAVSGSLKREFGIAVSPMTTQEASSLGLDSPTGVVVQEVDSKSPFRKAGFEKGDIILQVENQPVNDADSLFGILSSLKSKQKISLTAVDSKTGRAGRVIVKMR